MGQAGFSAPTSRTPDTLDSNSIQTREGRSDSVRYQGSAMYLDVCPLHPHSGGVGGAKVFKRRLQKSVRYVQTQFGFANYVRVRGDVSVIARHKTSTQSSIRVFTDSSYSKNCHKLCDNFLNNGWKFLNITSELTYHFWKFLVITASFLTSSHIWTSSRFFCWSILIFSRSCENIWNFWNEIQKHSRYERDRSSIYR